MNKDDIVKFRRNVLERFGATSSEVDELLAYNQNVFDHSALNAGLALPLDDEPFVQVWEEYAEEARQIGVFAALRRHLVQFNFPIQEGISATAEYQQAVRKGIVSENARQSERLELKRPDRLQLLIHQTLAGKIPLLIASERDDFVALIRAFTCKNEPKPIPASQGAAMMAGYNNWDRITRLKEAYQREQGSAYTEDGWAATFQTIMPQKHLYQDKFILLSEGTYYSGVTPEQVGLDDETWREQSLIIRREHECTHYFTKRVLSSMQNKVLDEFIADYAGIATATGAFNADWFLTFVGLEHYPTYREGGRLQNYKGTPPLSDGAFTILHKLVYHAAKNLETFHQQYLAEFRTKPNVTSIALALTHYTLEELASTNAFTFLKAYFQ